MHQYTYNGVGMWITLIIRNLNMAAVFANSSNQVAALKELYTDDKDYMKDLVYKEN